MMNNLIGGSLRERLVDIALEWQRSYGNAPSITSVVSEYDAARLMGMTEEQYSKEMQHRSIVAKGYDFMYQGKRYQVKACRPSGRPGSKVTWVPKPTNFEWDYLVWILYNEKYIVQEAWIWDVAAYRQEIEPIQRVSPLDIRKGESLIRSLPGS